VFERLTHEEVTETTVGELAAQAGAERSDETPFSDLSVLAVRVP